MTGSQSHVTALLLAISTNALLGDPLRAADYEIADVGYPNARQSWATGVNNAGQVTASLWTMVWDGYGYVWENGVVTRMPDQGSEANAINENGDVTGMLFLGGVIWNPWGGMTTFYSPGVCEKGLAINEARVVAGEFYREWSFDPPYAFIYAGGPMVTPLAFPGQSGVGSARGINAAGHVTGWSAVGGTFHMFLYRDGTMYDCGLYPGATETGGHAVTDDDVIVGYYTGAGRQHALLYDFGTGTWTPLAELPGATESVANAINARGVIVGSIFVGGQWRACVWDEHGRVHDLGARIPPGSGWQLTSATGVNDNGWIVGDGIRAGVRRAFLLTPLPRAAIEGGLDKPVEVLDARLGHPRP